MFDRDSYCQRYFMHKEASVGSALYSIGGKALQTAGNFIQNRLGGFLNTHFGNTGVANFGDKVIGWGNKLGRRSKAKIRLDNYIAKQKGGAAAAAKTEAAAAPATEAAAPAAAATPAAAKTEAAPVAAATPAAETAPGLVQTNAPANKGLVRRTSAFTYRGAQRRATPINRKPVTTPAQPSVAPTSASTPGMYYI